MRTSMFCSVLIALILLPAAAMAGGAKTPFKITVICANDTGTVNRIFDYIEVIHPVKSEALALLDSNYQKTQVTLPDDADRFTFKYRWCDEALCKRSRWDDFLGTYRPYQVACSLSDSKQTRACVNDREGMRTVFLKEGAKKVTVRFQNSQYAIEWDE